jgi:hypothetical protein
VARGPPANPAPKAVHSQFSIFNSQLWKCFSPARSAPKAAPLCTLRFALCTSTSRQGPLHSQFSILNSQFSHRFSQANSTPSHSSLRVEQLFTFKLSHCIPHANPAPKAVHSQFSVLNCGNAFRPRDPRQRLLHSALCALHSALAPRAKGRYILNSQFSILNFRTVFRRQTPRQATLHFA